MFSHIRFLMTATLMAAIVSPMVFGSTVTELDFTAWNGDILSTAGGVQLFPNAAPGLDVTVTSVGEFDAPTRYITTTDGGIDEITSSHDPGEDESCHGFILTFSQPTDIILMTQSLDAEEDYKISSAGSSITYTNESGIAPIVAGQGTSILEMEGVAFGRDPVTGSSDGSTFIDAPNSGPFSVNLHYCADPSFNHKYSAFRVFSASPAVSTQSLVQLPEPNPAALMGIGGAFVLLSLRRRRR